MPTLDENRLGLLPDLAEALMDVGQFAASEAVCREAMSAAEAIGDHRLRAEAGLGLLLVQLHGNEDAWGRRALREAERAIPVFEPSATSLAWPRPGASSGRCTPPRFATGPPPRPSSARWSARMRPARR